MGFTVVVVYIVITLRLLYTSQIYSKRKHVQNALSRPVADC